MKKPPKNTAVLKARCGLYDRDVARNAVQLNFRGTGPLLTGETDVAGNGTGLCARGLGISQADLRVSGNGGAVDALDGAVKDDIDVAGNGLVVDLPCLALDRKSVV